jgi:hypothetical protein
MPIQTAPSTLTLTHADSKESVLTLLDVSDSLVTFSVTQFADQAIGDVRIQPQVTIARRAKSSTNGGPKHTIRLQAPQYDLLGVKTATMGIFVDIVKPTAFSDAAPFTSKEFIELAGLLVGNSLVQVMGEDGSFLR